MIVRVTEGNVDALRPYPCVVCHREFKVDDDLLRIPIGPATPEDRLRAYGGHAYSSSSVYVHLQCSALEHCYRDLVPMLRNMIDDQRVLIYEILERVKVLAEKVDIEDIQEWAEEKYKGVVGKYLNVLRL